MMNLSPIFEKNLKAQIVSILISGQNKTARQLFHELKKRNIDSTLRGIYKALEELLKQKVIIKFSTDYEINPNWISELGTDTNQALRKLLEKNLLGAQVKELKHPCICEKGNTEGFCNLCLEMVCSQCGIKNMKHINCEATCINCQCGHMQGTCTSCNKRACLGCSKEMWVHEYRFCKSKNTEKSIAIMEVDHECWFSNTSEKYPEDILLNNFSDVQDRKLGTHSGVIRIEVDDKDMFIQRILRQQIIRSAQIIHKQGKSYYIKTRADINKSVDQFTQENKSILLNPIIARDTKEQNLILAPSQKEMKAVSKGLQEFGGKVRLVCMETINLNQLDKIQNKRITEFLEKVPKKELLDELQKVRIN